MSALDASYFPLSGASDGYVRLWKCGDAFRSLEPCFAVPLVSIRLLALLKALSVRPPLVLHTLVLSVCLVKSSFVASSPARCGQLPVLLPLWGVPGGGCGTGAQVWSLVEGGGRQEWCGHHPSDQAVCGNLGHLVIECPFYYFKSF